MPFVSNMEDQKDPSLQGPVSPTAGGSNVKLSSSAGPTGGAPSGAPSAGGTPPPSGGQFGNLQQYLTANQGQAQPLANTLTQGINQQYQGLQNANTQTASDINAQIAAGAAPSQSAANATIAAESANPAAFAGNAGNVQQFQGLLNAAYSGPLTAQGTTNFQKQQNAINQAIATGQGAVTTEAGREGLLQPIESTPTQGVTALNSAILSQDPNALQSVETAYKPFEGLTADLSQKASDANQKIAQEQAGAQSDVNAANQAITQQASGINQAVQNQLTAAQTAAQKQNAQVQADVKAGNASDADLAAMGISRDQWNTLSNAQKAAATATTVSSPSGKFTAQTGTANVDITPFLTQSNPNQAITASNVATPDQYAAVQALQNLVSGTQGAQPTFTINPAAASQAGTAPTNLNQFDYQAALNTANATRQDEVAAAQAYVDAIQSGADEQHAQEAAATAARQGKEQAAELISGVGAPVALASNLPVIGAPIRNAVDTVVQTVTGGSWICTEMIRAEVVTKEEIQKLHDFIYQAFWKNPIPFIKYFFLGQPLVYLTRYIEVDWIEWKAGFYDKVMAAENATKAVELYEQAFWLLADDVYEKALEKINA